MATYTLFRWGRRDTTGESLMFPTGRRTNWVARLRLGSVEAGASVQVTIEAAPVDDDDEFVEVHDFTALDENDVGVIEVSTKGETPGFTIEPYHMYLRGTIAAIDGLASFELEMEGSFFDFDNPDDAALLTKEFRGHNPAEVKRILNLAERDVVDLLQIDRDHGFMEPWINDPGFLEAIKAEIAQQGDHLFRREQLGRKKDPTSQVTLRETPYKHPDMGKRLQDYIPSTSPSSAVWLGRG